MKENFPKSEIYSKKYAQSLMIKGVFAQILTKMYAVGNSENYS